MRQSDQVYYEVTYAVLFEVKFFECTININRVLVNFVLIAYRFKVYWKCIAIFILDLAEQLIAAHF